MNTIGKQFDDIIKPRVELALERGSKKMADLISDQMQENSQQGHAFKQDPYVNVYHPQSVFERKRLGLQTGIVTLRRVNKRIEDTRVVYTKGTGAVIKFEQDGIIFKEHHMGEALTKPFNRNVPMRSIFPKTRESVPDDIIEDTQIFVQEVLSGSK
jgi:hypothetical protein